MRRLVRETRLTVDDLIMPPLSAQERALNSLSPSMPGNFQMSVDVLVEEAKVLQGLGIPGIILFGIPGEEG